MYTIELPTERRVEYLNSEGKTYMVPLRLIRRSLQHLYQGQQVDYTPILERPGKGPG